MFYQFIARCVATVKQLSHKNLPHAKLPSLISHLLSATQIGGGKSSTSHDTDNPLLHMQDVYGKSRQFVRQ